MYANTLTENVASAPLDTSTHNPTTDEDSNVQRERTQMDGDALNQHHASAPQVASTNSLGTNPEGAKSAFHPLTGYDVSDAYNQQGYKRRIEEDPDSDMYGLWKDDDFDGNNAPGLESSIFNDLMDSFDFEKEIEGI